MAENERDFKGVWIPKEVWLDTRLNALEKVILIEIDSLDNGERGCYKSNKNLAEFCQCSETKISLAISKLTELGYVYTQNFNGRERELKSSLSNYERQTFKKCEADLQILKESNTISNTLSNNIIYIVEYLNEKANVNFKPNSKKTQSLLKGLLTTQNYSVEDCITVIDKKCSCWLGTEFAKYLRPETLFGNKFESYLNEPITPQKKKKYSFDDVVEDLNKFMFMEDDTDLETLIECTDEYKKIMGEGNESRYF